ncbi:hypothetical protein E2562_027538 [Oryza meyeriana var. granulata]|uniref:Uncharacterized protein n=1 Tax=Oryza meyeriana var. granulata TaxID=110450 RepID=A0A6G1CJ32_9ORYZ|nr:hypothetical protein E2562_027538 [Oryza meyeriana var. granulata]
MFGTPENFWTEVVTFDFTTFAVLGQLAQSMFMAATHYAYLMMRMSRLRGPFSVRGEFESALSCDRKSLNLEGTSLGGSVGVPLIEPPQARTWVQSSMAGEIKEVSLCKATTIKISVQLDNK